MYAEFKSRLLLERAAMGKLDKIWKDKDISNGTKIKLVQSLVFPEVIYACQTWTVKKVE